MKESRFTEVSHKLKDMYDCADECRKDGIVKSLKRWVKSNPNTEDKGKLDAINCFLADNGIF